MPEVDELMRRARRAESDGELREALRLCRAALDAGTPEGGGPPDDPDVLRGIADLHRRLDEPDAARAALVRYLDAAGEGAVDPDRAAEAVRSHLADHPHQRLAIRAARVLDRAGRTGEAVDVLRRTWETRTGRRLPAGDIEKAAREVAPGVDLASWTPEWPPTGGDGASRALAARAAGRPEDGGRVRGVAGDDEEREDGKGRTVRRQVHRYDRRPGGSGEDDASSSPRRTAPRAEASNGGDDLRRGLEVLEELLELDPGDTRLRRRKVRYARRLGDPGLLEEALLDLGDVLDESGAHRGARLLYDEVLDRLNPGSRRAEAGLRRVEAGMGPSRARVDAPARRGAPSGSGEVDEEFRRRLSEALERAPRELEHLREAGLAALGAADERAVPWRAHRGLGRYLLLRGRPEQAARHLAAARERAPREAEETADVLYDLGVAHRRAGRADGARDCFRRLADRDPGFAAAWEALST